MKTSEFIKYFQSEFYYVEEYSNGIFVTDTDIDNLDLFYLDRNKNSFNTIKFGFESLDFSKQQEYYKVIFEYLMTPPEEREEEKRYYLKLKGFDGEQPYLCAYDFWSDWKLIDKDELKHGDEFYFKFTQKQIDEMPKCYTHPAVWEQIEVESEKE